MATTYFALKYGSFVYGTLTERTGQYAATFKDAMPAVLRTAQTPSIDGEYSAGGKLGPRRPTLTGTLIAADPADPSSIRALKDSFLAAHAPGQPQQLYIDDDRYLNAEVESVDFADWKGLPVLTFTVGFYCSDPVWYSAIEGYPADSAACPVALASGANTITTLGRWSSLPIITIPVTSFTAGATITITNQIGQTFTITPAATGNTVIDSYEENVTDGSGNSLMSTFVGEFLALASGANTVTVATTGTIDLGTVTISWQDRWI